MFSAALYVSLILFMSRPTVAAQSSPGSICSQCHGWSRVTADWRHSPTLRTVLGQATYTQFSDLRSQPFSAPNDSIWRRRGTKQLNLWRNIGFQNVFNVFIFSVSRSVAGGLVCQAGATLSMLNPYLQFWIILDLGSGRQYGKSFWAVLLESKLCFVTVFHPT